MDEEEAAERLLAMQAQSSMGFDVITSVRPKYQKPPPIAEEPDDDVIGRYGFRRLIMNGALINKEYSIQIMDSLFDDIDHAKNGYITFVDLWSW